MCGGAASSLKRLVGLSELSYLCSAAYSSEVVFKFIDRIKINENPHALAEGRESDPLKPEEMQVGMPDWMKDQPEYWVLD